MPPPWFASPWFQALGQAFPRLVAGIALAAALVWLFPARRRELLLALSLGFFGLFLGAPLVLGQLAFAGIWYGLLRWADKACGGRGKKAVALGVIAAFAAGYFALMNAGRFGLAAPSVQTLGIAYLFWRVLHVNVDWLRGTLRLSSLTDFLLYLFYFPTMKGGPIQRYQDFFATEFFQDIDWRPHFNLGMSLRIVGGLAKLWACYFWIRLDYDALWPQTAALPYAALLQILYARAISFYLIASGANDLTITLSEVLRIRLPENYDYPYFQRNLAHFWRNWHRTLTACLRDYVYEPLGGKRKRQYRNYVLTFLVCAFWHVTSPAFLIWGLWHGLGLCVLRLWQDFWKLRVPALGPGGAWLRRIQAWMQARPVLAKTFSGLLTFHFVALSWLPFWGGHPQGTRAIFRLLGLPWFW